MSSPSMQFSVRALRATLRLLYLERNALDSAIHRLEGLRFRACHPARIARRRRAVLVSKPR